MKKISVFLTVCALLAVASPVSVNARPRGFFNFGVSSHGPSFGFGIGSSHCSGQAFGFGINSCHDCHDRCHNNCDNVIVEERHYEPVRETVIYDDYDDSCYSDDVYVPVRTCKKVRFADDLDDVCVPVTTRRQVRLAKRGTVTRSYKKVTTRHVRHHHRSRPRVSVGFGLFA